MKKESPWHAYLRSEVPDETSRIRAVWAEKSDKIVVLDDDPTGCQTVHDLPVLFDWEEATLRDALTGPDGLFYILTNIRSVSAGEAERRHEAVAARLTSLSSELQVRVHVISRSDSTLRGHFPEDLRPFWRVKGSVKPDAVMLIPAFFEGGRYTYQGTHYVEQDNHYLPAHETEFARDRAFGFQSSYLPNWVAEKWPEQKGRVRVLGLDIIRQGVAAVAAVLATMNSLQIIAVDAVDYHDLEVVALGCMQREWAGQHFLFRTAASFVKAFGGISTKGLLQTAQLISPHATGGLVMVGSHVTRTNEQLSAVLKLDGIAPVELDVAKCIHGTEETEVPRVIAEISSALQQGQDVVCYTTRRVEETPSVEESLRVGRRVADAINGVVSGLTTRPSFILAKGGITSHEIAQFGLGVRKAWVRGQVAEGVPVWELGSESKWPELPYIVFPGNVGTSETLANVVLAFQKVRQSTGQ